MITPFFILSLVIGYFIVLLTIAYFTAKDDTNESFFKANRNSPWYLVAFGMVGASLSGVTFISVPGWVESSQFTYFQVVMGYLVGYFVVAYVLLPVYYKNNVTSIYEYLNTRLGQNSHKAGAFFFFVSRVLGAAFRLFLVAIVLQQFIFDALGVPYELTVVLSIVLIWVYTQKGGIKTIVFTDTLQSGLMIAAVILSIIYINQALDWSFSEFLASSELLNYNQVLVTDSLLSRNHFLKSFIGGAFVTICMTGLDQDMMQKNLSCKNLKSAQLNMVSFAGVLIIVNLIFLVLGALLFMYFEQTGIGSNVLKISNPRTDLLFAEIAKNGSLGVSVGVLFLLGLIAAAYSSADSALTSLTTSFSIDFLNVETKPIDKQPKIRKAAHLMMSLILILIIIFLRRFSDDSAIWMLIKLAGFTYGPLIGLFFFGILTKRNLIDKLVPLVSVVVPFIIAIIWYEHGKGNVQWLGTYDFGAELIIYNSLLSFGSLFLISKSKS